MSQRRTSLTLISVSLSGSTGRWVGSGCLEPKAWFLLQVWLPVWLYNLVVVCSAGPKRWRTGEDDPAGEGVQRLCAATSEDNCFRGDRENQRTALRAVPPRWRGVCLTDNGVCRGEGGASTLCCFQVFVSKDVARHFGFLSAEAALRGFYTRVKQGWLKSLYPRFRLKNALLRYLRCLCCGPVLGLSWYVPGQKKERELWVLMV